MATADAAKGGETATPSASQLQAIVAAAQSADLLAAQSEVDELRRTVSDLTIEKERLKQVRSPVRRRSHHSPRPLSSPMAPPPLSRHTPNRKLTPNDV